MALLIDGDNVQHQLVNLFIKETEKFGVIFTIRVYGNPTALKGWNRVINEYSITPVQIPKYTKTSKNSSDIGLVIDAIDILYKKNIDGICIVSSDSDFITLVNRLRNDGVFTMGIGKSNSTELLRKSHDIFINIDDLSPSNLVIDSTTSNIKKNINYEDEVLKEKLMRAFNESVNNNGFVISNTLGRVLKKNDPSFKPTNHNFKNLFELISHFNNEFKTEKLEGRSFKIYKIY